VKYGVVQTVAPIAYAVSAEMVADYCRIDAATNSTEIELLLAQATEEAERMTGRALVSATYRMTADGWPEGVQQLGVVSYPRSIELPRTPLISVTGVQYYDEDGVQQTLDPASYLVITDTQPGQIYLKSDTLWPTTERRPDAVSITFTAGHSPAAVPPTLKQAMLLLCRHFNSAGNPDQYSTNDHETARTLLVGMRIGGWSA